MDTLPPLPCYLNGEFTELPKAKISVMDRGFIFGDGVYEVAPVYAGQLFRFDQHMARLERSLAELRIANPLSKAQWTAIAQQLITGYAKSTGEREQDIDQLIYDAKQKVLGLAVNYRPARPVENIPAPGRSIAASIRSQLWNMKMGNFVTEYEAEMGALIAQVLCGGDVNAGTPISENYLLQLEREAFLKLCGNKKTAERIQHMLKKGKPLRN